VAGRKWHQWAGQQRLCKKLGTVPRTLGSAVKKEAAEARLKEIEVLRAEIALLDDLKKAGVILREAEALALNRVPRR